MWQTLARLLVACLVLQANSLAFQTNASVPAGEAVRVAKIRAEVQKRGTGARVRVSLSSGTEIKGHISNITDGSFDVTDRKTGNVLTIQFAETEKVRGPGLSHSAEVVLGIGIVAVAIIAIVVAVYYPKT
jgi:hypothetical protein